MSKAPKTAAERLNVMNERMLQAKAQADRLAGAASEEERREIFWRLLTASAQETVTEGLINMLQNVGSHHSVAPVAADQAAAVRELTDQAYEIAAKATGRLVAQDKARQAKEKGRREKISKTKEGRKKKPVLFAKAYARIDEIRSRHPAMTAAAMLTKLERDLPEGTDIPSERQIRRYLTGS